MPNKKLMIKARRQKREPAGQSIGGQFTRMPKLHRIARTITPCEQRFLADTLESKRRVDSALIADGVSRGASIMSAHMLLNTTKVPSHAHGRVNDLKDELLFARSLDQSNKASDKRAANRILKQVSKSITNLRHETARGGV